MNEKCGSISEENNVWIKGGLPTTARDQYTVYASRGIYSV
uniref:Uncharacterized protein n=1 Tax=Arundo donax TaxID=35708 RepID=A0A0A9CPA6_ARUDO